MPAKTAAKTKACETCTHYKATSTTKGECRRHAPQTVVFNVDDKVKFESRFPATKATDWCGEYAKA